MRTFLVGGSPTGRQPVRLAPGPDDRVIAADRGAQHAHAWGWPVHLLVGDMDSLPADEIEAANRAGTPSIIVPAAKDETDLELALAHALAEGARTIVICAALGGRTDHLLANVLLLARPELSGLDVMIADGPETLHLLRGNAQISGGGATREIPGAAGDLLSLLPISNAAVGVTTVGLLYPLHNETLFLGQARGISNVFTGTNARIALQQGLLVVIHTAGGPPDR